LSKSKLLFADDRGTVYAHPHLLATQQAGPAPAPLEGGSPLVYGTQLMFMPGWNPLGIDPATGRVEALEGVHAVAAVPPPGFLRLSLPAAVWTTAAPPLPLYAYTAVGAGPRENLMAAARVDARRRWDTACYDTPALPRGIARLRKRFPANRILCQLARCATEYFCSTARNLFLERYEAALPLADTCNSRCLGCISKQVEDHPCSQERLAFTPSVAEGIEIAASHFEAARDPIVSFGQGCEGEPLTRADLICEIIRATRKKTRRGLFHMNTNGSLPAAFEACVAAGLGSVRVSLSSAIPHHYALYTRPKGYTFAEVTETLLLAARAGVFSNLNLLVYPGITDTPAELAALVRLCKRCRVEFIQLRNLAIDPALMPPRGQRRAGKVLGMADWLARLRAALPGVGLGCYNSTRAEISRFRKDPP
jgi:pyruvate-formate lyase-activating enzyme